MPITTLFGAAALSTGVSSLWQYNRENYMFEMPLRQTQVYQLHNIMIARFGLFREDIRDLCALTTSKVQSYLIVNTLKLGFIITMYYNFDRVDNGNEDMNFEEAQINLLFSMFMLTGAFWLLSSIWFSMHGLVVAQSLMTKMLVRVVRIPLPNEQEIMEASSDARHFERNIAEAFRVPLLGPAGGGGGKRKEQKGAGGAGGSGGGTHANSAGSAGGFGANSGRSDETLHQFLPTSREAPAARSPMNEWRAPSGATIGGKEQSEREGAPLASLSILDLLYADAMEDLDPRSQASQVACSEPHIKLFKLLRASWEPFDFYSKVAMEMGTATMLSGFAYYGLYYMRTSGMAFQVESGGWCAFCFMSVLSWWSLILDLNLSWFQHLFVGFAVLSGPMALVIGYNQSRMHWLLTTLFLTSTVWVICMCWSGVSCGDKWPRWWRAAVFLNVLHSEDGPTAQKEDVSRTVRMAPGVPSFIGGPTSSSPGGFARANTLNSAYSAGSVDSCGSDDWVEEPEHAHKVSEASIFVGPLLAAFEHMLTWPLDKALRRTLRVERDHLYEAARAHNSANHMRFVRPLAGFWVVLPHGFHSQPDAEWLDPCGDGNPSGAPTITLEELLQAARGVAEVLFVDAYAWTLRDMEAMVMYGGEPVPGVRSFTAQFQRLGSDSRHSMGQMAFRFFLGGACVVSALWLTALGRSLVMAANRESAPLPPRTLSGFKVLDWQLPLPWLAPNSLACDDKGETLVLADHAAGAWIWRNTSGWEGPHTLCGQQDTIGADVTSGGTLWIACPDGLRPQPVSVLSSSQDSAAVAAATAAGLDPSRGISRIEGLQAVALDAAPDERSVAHGLAIRNGQLVALQASKRGGGAAGAAGAGAASAMDPRDLEWRIAGTLNAPSNRNFTSLGLAFGRGIVTDGLGLLYEVDTATGIWRGPFKFPNRRAWEGICAIGDGSSLLALAARGAEGYSDEAPGRPELWRFQVPSDWDASDEAITDEDGVEWEGPGSVSSARRRNWIFPVNIFQ